MRATPSVAFAFKEWLSAVRFAVGVPIQLSGKQHAWRVAAPAN